MSRISAAAMMSGVVLLSVSIHADDRSPGVEARQPLLLAPAAETELRIAAETATGESTQPEGITFSTPQTPGRLSAPDIPSVPPEVPVLPSPPPLQGPPVVLYPHVRVKDPHKVHPLGVPTVIPVPDPRDHRGVVHIEVCMPPFPCEKFKRNRRGTRAEFDFGKYEIDIITRRGVVTIDYDS